MRKKLYLIAGGEVSEIDVSYMTQLVSNESYMRERIVAYTETEQQAMYCAKLYYHNFTQPSNTVIDGETWSVLTLPENSVLPFLDRPSYDDAELDEARERVFYLFLNHVVDGV